MYLKGRRGVQAKGAKLLQRNRAFQQQSEALLLYHQQYLQLYKNLYMGTDNIDDTIPEQETGSKTDTHHSVTAPDELQAKALFVLAKERLQDVNHWKTYAGKASAVFSLTDDNGMEVDRKAAKGDHFRINIPAPGTEAGDGNDWVQIEAIEDKSNPGGIQEAFAIRVRPSSQPGKKGEDVAHFFKDDATSTFAVQRQGLKVTASVHGRNEKPNTTSEGIMDKVRNTVVAIGAMLGMSDTQWKSLVKGLLEYEDK